MIKDLNKSTLPILLAEENIDDEIQPVYEGSGILFKYNSDHFIFTAAHVFDNVDSSISFHVPNGNEMINVNGDLRKDDNFDIAIFKILDSEIEKFKDFIFLEESDLEYKDPKKYYVAGYPFEKTFFVSKSSELKYTFLHGILNQNSSKVIKGDMHSTLFLEYPNDWFEKKLPHPRGMSGSGVWMQKNDCYKLLGINTYFDGHDCIKATRVHLYMEILKHLYKFPLKVPLITKVTFK